MTDSALPPHSLHTLFSEHHGWLQGWLRRKTGCSEQAADLAQDTFVRLMSAPGLLPLREPRSYLVTVARRLLIDHSRRVSLERAYLDALALMPQPVAPSPEDRLLILESLQQIDTMLDGLPPRARTAFLLAQLEGLSYREIAIRLGITERSVKRYMAQAFEQCILLVA